MAFSGATYAGTGMGLAIGIGTGMAISSAQAQANSDTAIKIELCKAQQNIMDVKSCLLKLQEDEDKDNIHYIIWGCVLIVFLVVIFCGLGGLLI